MLFEYHTACNQDGERSKFYGTRYRGTLQVDGCATAYADLSGYPVQRTYRAITVCAHVRFLWRLCDNAPFGRIRAMARSLTAFRPDRGSERRSQPPASLVRDL